MELSVKKTVLIFIFCSLVSFNIYARGTARAIVVDPYFGFGYMSPSDINDKITMDPGGVGTIVPGAGPIHWDRNLGTFIGYRFNHRFNVGLIFDYSVFNKLLSRDDPAGFPIWHPSSKTQISGAKYYEFSTGSNAFSFGPAFYYSIFSGGKLTFDAGLGILYAKVKYVQSAVYSKISSSDPAPIVSSLSGSGSAFGFAINTATGYYFTNYLALAFNLGYRYLKCNSLYDASGNLMKFQFNNGVYDTGNMTVNFSGFYFSFGVKVDFNISGVDTAAGTAPEEQNAWNGKPAGSDVNAGWEQPPLANEGGPTLEDVHNLKKQVQRKYSEVKTSNLPDAQMKMERYQKLYDITNRLERDWDQYNPKSRMDKIEKIKLILSR